MALSGKDAAEVIAKRSVIVTTANVWLLEIFIVPDTLISAIGAAFSVKLIPVPALICFIVPEPGKPVILLPSPYRYVALTILVVMF